MTFVKSPSCLEGVCKCLIVCPFSKCSSIRDEICLVVTNVTGTTMARHVGKYYVCCVCQNLVCSVYANVCMQVDVVCMQVCAVCMQVRVVFMWCLCICVVCMSKSFVVCMSNHVKNS